MPTNLFADTAVASDDIGQMFTPTVGQTSFTLTVAPTNAALLKMKINGATYKDPQAGRVAVFVCDTANSLWRIYC